MTANFFCVPEFVVIVFVCVCVCACACACACACIHQHFGGTCCSSLHHFSAPKMGADALLHLTEL